MFKTAEDLSFIMQREAKAQKKLSKAAIETLSIIAYHQPVTRAEIEDIRGVNVSPGTIDTLLQMNWIKIKGRRKVLGNPIVYGTTDEFLVHFDLENIKDLPDMKELKSMGLLDNNLPPDLYPENIINDNNIEEIDAINSIEVDGEI
jgi:segregation and condensation protein B